MSHPSDDLDHFLYAEAESEEVTEFEPEALIIALTQPQSAKLKNDPFIQQFFKLHLLPQIELEKGDTYFDFYMKNPLCRVPCHLGYPYQSNDYTRTFNLVVLHQSLPPLLAEFIKDICQLRWEPQQLDGYIARNLCSVNCAVSFEFSVLGAAIKFFEQVPCPDLEQYLLILYTKHATRELIAKNVLKHVFLRHIVKEDNAIAFQNFYMKYKAYLEVTASTSIEAGWANIFQGEDGSYSSESSILYTALVHTTPDSGILTTLLQNCFYQNQKVLAETLVAILKHAVPSDDLSKFYLNLVICLGCLDAKLQGEIFKALGKKKSALVHHMFHLYLSPQANQALQTGIYDSNKVPSNFVSKYLISDSLCNTNVQQIIYAKQR